MSVKVARIQPCNDDDFSAEARSAVLRHLPEEKCDLNLIRTFARSPLALDPFLAWADYHLSKTTLADREREILTVRVAFLAGSDYELAQHVKMSRDAGVTADEFRRLRNGDDGDWSPADAALIKAADDIVKLHCVSDQVWRDLALHFTQRQMMDIVMTGAQYLHLAVMLNSFGVEVESDLRSKLSEALQS